MKARTRSLAVPRRGGTLLASGQLQDAPWGDHGIAFVAGLTAAALTIVVVLFSAARGPHTLGALFDVGVWILGLVVLLTCFVSWRVIGRFDPFLFPAWFAVNLYAQTVLNVWWFDRTNVDAYFWLRVGDEFAWARVLLAFAVTMLAVLVGFRAGLGHRPETRVARRNWEPVDLRRAVFVMVLGVLPHLVIRDTGFAGTGDTTWTNYLFIADSLASVALISVVITAMREPTPWTIGIACGGALLEMFNYVYAGSKLFAVVLVWMVACWFYARRRLPVALTALGLAVIVILVPVVNVFRLNLFSNTGTVAGRFEQLVSAASAVAAHSFGESADETTVTMSSRQGCVFHYSGAIFTTHPDLRPFVGPEMFELFTESIVPRFIWWDKPTTHPELYLLGVQYQGLKQEGSFASIGVVADSYRTGGWPFVAVIALGIGLLGVALYRFGPLNRSVPGTALYILVTTTVLTYERSLFEEATSVLHVVIPALILARWLVPSSRSNALSISARLAAAGPAAASAGESRIPSLAAHRTSGH